MANRIKGITVEIGVVTTGLDKALRGVNSTIKTAQSSLKDDFEKKAFVNTFIDSIELYPDKKKKGKEGSCISMVHFKFPVAYNGETVYDCSTPKETTDETIVLFSNRI